MAATAACAAPQLTASAMLRQKYSLPFFHGLGLERTISNKSNPACWLLSPALRSILACVQSTVLDCTSDIRRGVPSQLTVAMMLPGAVTTTHGCLRWPFASASLFRFPVNFSAEFLPFFNRGVFGWGAASSIPTPPHNGLLQLTLTAARVAQQMEGYTWVTTQRLSGGSLSPRFQGCEPWDHSRCKTPGTSAQGPIAECER